MKRKIVCFTVVGSALFALAAILPNHALAQPQPRQPGVQPTQSQRPGTQAAQPQRQQEEIAPGDKRRADFNPFVSGGGGEGGLETAAPMSLGLRSQAAPGRQPQAAPGRRSQTLQQGLRQIESGAFEVTQVTPSLRAHGVQVGWVWHGGYWHIPPTRRVVGCTWVWSPRGWRLVCREVWVQPPPPVCGWCRQPDWNCRCGGGWAPPPPPRFCQWCGQPNARCRCWRPGW